MSASIIVRKEFWPSVSNPNVRRYVLRTSADHCSPRCVNLLLGMAVWDFPGIGDVLDVLSSVRYYVDGDGDVTFGIEFNSSPLPPPGFLPVPEGLHAMHVQS